MMSTTAVDPHTAGQQIVAKASDLTRSFEIRTGLRTRRVLHALTAVSFSLRAGETLGVVGESGCGKSTLARIMALIDRPTAGTIELFGTDAIASPRDQRRALRSRVQMVFQNPYASLNPRQRVGQSVMEPLAINSTLSGEEARSATIKMLERVGLRPEHANRYPHMFSGGQRQRLAIARSLMLKPGILIADEPVAALDVSIQAQIINLLVDLQDELRTAYLFISHDLRVVRHISHHVLIMYLGQVVEYGEADIVLDRPCHPYTQLLLLSVPQLPPGRRTRGIAGSGEIPSPLNPPSGCAFRTRCRLATAECAASPPTLRLVDGRQVACHHAERTEWRAIRQAQLGLHG